jgi:hypothetical protein
MIGRTLAFVAALALIAFDARADEVFGGTHTERMPGRMTPMGEMGAAPGALPSPEHPRGTIILAQSLHTKRPTLTEWDLAREEVVRRVQLGGSGDIARVVRTGPVLHAVVGEPVRYLQVDAATWKVLHVTPLAREGYDVEIASDGTLTIVAFEQGTNAWQAATLDAAGHVLGTLRRAMRPRLVGNARDTLAVLGGKAYVVVRPGLEGHHLLTLAPDASVIADTALDTHGPGPTIGVQRGRLVIGDAHEILELSPQLEVTARHCVPFGADVSLAASADGRVVTSHGDLLSAALVQQSSYQGAGGGPRQALWVGDTPVLVSVDAMAFTYGWVAWLDLSVPGSPPLEAPCTGDR